jgi:succinoglycan biosynthesis transport protein ExoP
MYLTPSNMSMPEPPNPTAAQYPLRPASRTSPFRINILRSLRLHKVSAIVVTLVVLSLGLAFAARHKPYYAATSTIYVSPTQPKTLIEDRELDRPYESYISEVTHDVTRYDILAEAIEKMPAGLWQGPAETERNAVARLQHSLDIARVGTTYQVQVTLEGYRPEHLAEIVNIVTNVFIEKSRHEEYYGRDERLATLKDELAATQAKSDALLKEQAQINTALGVATVAKGAAAVDTDNAKMQADLTTARELRMQAQAQLSALENGDPNAPNSALSTAADEITAADPGLTALKQSLSTQRASLVGQLAGMTESHPLYKQTQERLVQINKAIEEMQVDLRKKAAARLKQKYQTQLNQAEIYESHLNGQLLQGTRLAATQGPRIQRAEEIQAELERLQTHYAQVEERMSNLEIESSSPGSVHLFSPALPPITPEKSKIKAFLVILFPFSCFLGLMTALVQDFFDPHIYTATDVEGVLGFAPIGMLFDDREVTQIVYDECALRLAAGVDHAARTSGARTFVISAINSGAGTTTIIESLGSTLARLGRKTLVIDPSGSAEPVAYMTHGTDLQKHPVTLPDPAAAASSTPGTELQPANRFGRTQLPARVPPVNSFVYESFKALATEYDIVLIDAAPLLLSAETEYLARMADVTVMVAEAGKTKKKWLTRAARLLERLSVAGAAAIINKVNPARIDEAAQQDLREFELRSDRVNLQDWWKPRQKQQPQPQSRPTETPAYTAEEAEATTGNVLFARDR